jgi:hypothetical protein
MPPRHVDKLQSRETIESRALYTKYKFYDVGYTGERSLNYYHHVLYSSFTTYASNNCLLVLPQTKHIFVLHIAQTYYRRRLSSIISRYYINVHNANEVPTGWHSVFIGVVYVFIDWSFEQQ